MKQWYVIKSLFNQEKRAEAHLLNQGVECYLPLFTCQLVAGEALNRLNPSHFFLAICLRDSTLKKFIRRQLKQLAESQP